MKLAALYDVHGNLPALKAVVEEIENSGVDKIVFGGDIVPGPMPSETFKFIATIDIPVSYISGNGETAVINVMNDTDPGNLPAHAIESIKWSAMQLNEENKIFMQSWPKTLIVDLENFGRVLFCHATPRDENELFTIRTHEEKLFHIFKNVEADVVICGHTHMQFKKQLGKTSIVNAGSVGMPIGKSGAFWVLIGNSIELRHTMYDVHCAVETILDTKYPLSEEFVSNLIEPPSEDKVLDLYDKVS